MLPDLQWCGSTISQEQFHIICTTTVALIFCSCLLIFIDISVLVCRFFFIWTWFYEILRKILNVVHQRFLSSSQTVRLLDLTQILNACNFILLKYIVIYSSHSDLCLIFSLLFSWVIRQRNMCLLLGSYWIEMYLLGRQESITQTRMGHWFTVSVTYAWEERYHLAVLTNALEVRECTYFLYMFIFLFGD